MKYDVRHETRHGRCVWCWETLGDREPHAVAQTAAQPHFPGGGLRMHRKCWESYSAIAGPALVDTSGFGRKPEWPPERIELLRIHCGLNFVNFCKKLRYGPDRLKLVMEGVETPNRHLADRLKALAVSFGYERTDEIDWSDPAAFMSLKIKIRKTNRDLESMLGASKKTVQQWLSRGIPKLSLRQNNKVGQLARLNNFERADIVQARVWAVNEIQALLDASGLTKKRFAHRLGVNRKRFTDLLYGLTGLSHEMAWRVTREAIRMGVELPEARWVYAVPAARPSGRASPAKEQDRSKKTATAH